VEARFYKTDTFPIEVPREASVPVNLVRQEFTLEVNSVPKAATIQLKELGTSFRNGQTLPAAEYTLIVSAPGYVDRVQSLVVDQDLVFPVSLEHAYYKLTLKTMPTDASIRIIHPDGFSYKNGGIMLPAGDIRLEVSAPLHQTRPESISLLKNETLEVRLESDCATNVAAIPGCIGHGQSAPGPSAPGGHPITISYQGLPGVSRKEVIAMAELAVRKKLADQCDGQLVVPTFQREIMPPKCWLDRIPSPGNHPYMVERWRCEVTATATCDEGARSELEGNDGPQGYMRMTPSGQVGTSPPRSSLRQLTAGSSTNPINARGDQPCREITRRHHPGRGLAWLPCCSF